MLQCFRSELLCNCLPHVEVDFYMSSCVGTDVNMFYADGECDHQVGSSSSSARFCAMLPTGSGAGNHPQLPKSTLSSPVRPIVTSTPSATRASRWRCAPCVPGPREEMVPVEPMTRCQGTGGLVLGERNLRAEIDHAIMVRR